MTVRMQVLRRAWMTDVVCGFSRFLRTNSPKRLSSCSTVSLQGGVRGHAVNEALPQLWALLAPGLLLPMPEAWFQGPPGQLLSCLQAGWDGQRLAGEGHDAVASGRVAL